jgi:tetratricopeptide (TPR) repeat protein
METQFDVAVDDPAGEAADGETFTLHDRKVAFSGRLEALNRQDIVDLVRRQGGVPVASADDADLLVVGMADLPLEDWDSLLSEPQARAAAEGRLTVISETRFWQLLGRVDTDPSVRRLYTGAMLAQLLNVPRATIRRWHRRGLIVPIQMVHKLAYYDFQEVVTARNIARLIASGASPKAIETKLSRLGQLFPDVQRPLAQLSVIVEGRDVLLRCGAGLIEPGGQRRIDFAALEHPTAEIPPETAAAFAESELVEWATPEQYRRAAEEFEDEGRPGDAIQVYRSMLLAFGPSVDVNMALAELLYLNAEVDAARERYFMAIELDQSQVEARASLGCLLLEQGDADLAISTLQGALKLHPDYADVHFHLARAFDDSLRPAEAIAHWRQFLELSPDNPWAEEARQRLNSV